MPELRTDRRFHDEAEVIAWIQSERPGAEITIERSISTEGPQVRIPGTHRFRAQALWRFIYETGQVIGHAAFVKEDNPVDPDGPRVFCQRGFQYERAVEEKEEEFDIPF